MNEWGLIKQFREIFYIMAGVVITVIFEGPLVDALTFLGVDPENFGKAQIGVLCLLVGFMAGAIVTNRLRDTRVLSEIAQNRRLRHLLTYEDEFKLPFIGWTPQLDVPTDILQNLDDVKSALTESINSITDAAVFQTNEDPGIIMITSSAPVEGKSTLCAGFARTLARRGKKVLVLDGDIRCPVQYKLFKVRNAPGLTDCAFSSEPAKNFIVQSDCDGVWIMPAGTAPPSPDPIWHQFSEHKRWEELRRNFDHIIVDAPPVIGLSDAPTIARSVKNVVFVVRHKNVQKSRTELALRRLHLAGGDVKILMAGTALPQHAYGYGYGYAYVAPDEHDQ